MIRERFMLFNRHVVMFDFGKVPVIGNLENGYVIGLTSEGAALCSDIANGAAALEEARARDAELFDCLLSNNFFSESTENHRLMSAYLHITQRCNLNCVGCYSFDRYRNCSSDASTSDMKTAINELGINGCERLFISGGEPFLRTDLPELIHHAKGVGIRKVTLITNGTCVNDDCLRDMATDIDVIAVSIDGYDANAQAYIRKEQRYDILVDAIQRIQNAGIAAHLTPTIHAKNIDDLDRYAELAKSLNTTVNFSILSCEMDGALEGLLPGENELKRLGKQLLELGMSSSAFEKPVGISLNVSKCCGTGTKELSIGADGTVYPCHMLHRPQWALGNVFQQPLSDILRGDRFEQLQALNVERFRGCSNCTHKFLCGGGCRARSFYEYGDLLHKDPYCTMSLTYYNKLSEALSG